MGDRTLVRHREMMLNMQPLFLLALEGLPDGHLARALAVAREQERAPTGQIHWPKNSLPTLVTIVGNLAIPERRTTS